VGLSSEKLEKEIRNVQRLKARMGQRKVILFMAIPSLVRALR